MSDAMTRSDLIDLAVREAIYGRPSLLCRIPTISGPVYSVDVPEIARLASRSWPRLLSSHPITEET
jgi:hypothetical protein